MYRNLKPHNPSTTSADLDFDVLADMPGLLVVDTGSEILAQFDVRSRYYTQVEMIELACDHPVLLHPRSIDEHGLVTYEVAPIGEGA